MAGSDELSSASKELLRNAHELLTSPLEQAAVIPVRHRLGLDRGGRHQGRTAAALG